MDKEQIVKFCKEHGFVLKSSEDNHLYDKCLNDLMELQITIYDESIFITFIVMDKEGKIHNNKREIPMSLLEYGCYKQYLKYVITNIMIDVIQEMAGF